MAIKVFDGTDNTFSTNGEIVLNPTRAIVHKEDNGSFYLDLETPLTQETKYVAPEEGSSATINGNGQIQDVDSTKESELVSLKGDTYQYTTTGKNILEPYPMNNTRNGITCSYDSATQTYTFNGTCTADNTTFQVANKEISFVNGQTRVSVHLVSGSATTYCVLRTFNSDYSRSTNVNLLNLSNSNPITYATCNGTNYTAFPGGISVRFNNGSVANNLKVKFMIAQDLDTTYEPYTNGASPNPTYPQSINVVSGLQEVEIKGFNLYNPINLDFVASISRYSKSGNGVISTTPTAIDWSSTTPPMSTTPNATQMKQVKIYGIQVEPNTAYTIIYDNPNKCKNEMLLFQYDKDYKYIRNNSNGVNDYEKRYFNITMQSNTKYVMFRFDNEDYNYGAKQFSVQNIMWVKGTYNSGNLPSYEEYKGKTYEINLGKNLLDIQNGTYSNNGVEAIVDNNTITLNGTATGTTSFINIPLNKPIYINGYFTISANNDFTLGDTNTWAGFRMADTSNNSIGNSLFFNVLNNSTTNIISDKVATKITIRTASGLSYNNNVIKPQYEIGIQATSYSEYFTPIELCKIGTYQDKIFKGKGVNLFDYTKNILNNANFGSGTFVSDNTCKLSYVECKPNTTYTISRIEPTTQRFFICTTEEEPQVGVAYSQQKTYYENTTKSITLTTSSTAKYIVIRFIYNEVNDYEKYAKTIQVQYGNSALEYEPYNAKDKWLLHKEIGKAIYDGSNDESWQFQNTSTTGLYRCNLANGLLKIGYYNAICNYFKMSEEQNFANITTPSFATHPNTQTLCFWHNETTLNNWKTWLSTHNVLVYYVLANPTTTEIDNSELVSELNNIELIGGINNISLSSIYLTGEIDLKYNFVSGGETTAKYIDYLQANNILVANTPQGNQAFRIANVERTRSKIRLKANHIFYDTQNYVIKDSYVVEKNCNQALDHLNDATDNTSPFSMTSNITTLNSYRCVRKSLYEAIQVVLERWGGHLVRDNFDIKVMSSIGNDNGVVVRYGKNLKNISATYNWDAVATKLMPVGKDGLLLPEEYLYASVQYDIPYTKVISFDQNNIVEDDYADEDAYQQALVDDLRQKGMEYLASNSIPMVNYTLNANLERITDIGDTIEVIDERLGINLLTNLISYEYNCILDKYTQVQFGNFTPKLQNLMETIASNTEKAIEENNGVIQITLENELAEATDRIWGVLGNSYVIYEGDKILVVDELPKENAHNVIMINSGGIGFSQTGINGTFQSAWTIDNTLNMENINVINLTADLIKGGILKLGSNLNQYGQIEIYNEANNLIAELNKNGFKMYGTDGSYVLMNTQVGFAGYDRNDNKIYWADGDAFHMKKSEVEEEITLCGKMRYIPIHLTDTYGVEHNGIGLVSVLGGGN